MAYPYIYLSEPPISFQMEPFCTRSAAVTPIEELMRAVLFSAIADLSGSDQEQRAAIEYFLSDEEEYVFSFIALCEYFGINSKRTRKLLLGGTNYTTKRRRVR